MRSLLVFAINRADQRPLCCIWMQTKGIKTSPNLLNEIIIQHCSNWVKWLAVRKQTCSRYQYLDLWKYIHTASGSERKKERRYQLRPTWIIILHCSSVCCQKYGSFEVSLPPVSLISSVNEDTPSKKMFFLNLSNLIPCLVNATSCYILLLLSFQKCISLNLPLTIIH